jgi:hypothetical protein
MVKVKLFVNSLNHFRMKKNPTKAQQEAWLRKHGCKSDEQLSDVNLLSVAFKALKEGITDKAINLAGNAFAKFDADTPISDSVDGVVTSDTRQIHWNNPKKNNEYTPLYFCDVTIGTSHKGSAAMSFDVYAKEQPKQKSTLALRTYKTDAGEIRASVNS